jgi:AcrR family transcriptional regulator
MTQPRGRTARGTATRERLISAALELFANRGFHGCTTAALAERSGIAEGTIYRHFESKESLYNEVMRLVCERGLELAAVDAGERGGARERLNAAAQRLFVEAQRSPATIRLLLRPAEQDVLEEHALRVRDRFRDALVQLIVSGKQDGSVRAGTAELWASVWIAIVGFVCERVAAGEWPPDHPNVGLALDAAWLAISRDSSTSLPVPGPAA